MSLASGTPVKQLNVDGGASVNNLMMQLQADLLNCSVIRPAVTETTALGAALFAGLAVNFWSGIDDIKSRWQVDKTFNPDQDHKPEELLRYWRKAVERTMHWIEN
jgi:glycerol kinase